MDNETYYSQHGEDFLLHKVFNKTNGFFIEVGCIDGLRFSNTLFFEKLGWKGLCIEAHNDYIELLNKNRPNSKVVHCAIGDNDKDDVVFYANARGSLSSLDKTTEERWRRDYAEHFTGFEEQVVKERTLTNVLDEFGVKEIDLLSIDIEGYEIEALMGLDFTKYKPEVLIVESDGIDHKRRIKEILSLQGYVFVLDFFRNLIFSLNKSHRSLICNKVFSDVKLIHTEHPLDNCGDIEHNRTLDTRSVNPMKQRLKSAIKSRLISLKDSFFNSKDDRELSEFIDIGFYGDEYLINVINDCSKDAVQFIETGTNVGSTLHYIASNFPEIKCYSCEPHLKSFEFAKSKVEHFSNVTIENIVSPDFFYKIGSKELFKKTAIFWLDSHGHGFRWPLKEEVAYITNNFNDGYLFIDDFKVPNQPHFGFDEYKEQICNWDFIKDSLKSNQTYHIIYPKYNEKTSKTHPLRGWVLIIFGKDVKGDLFSNRTLSYLSFESINL